MTQHLDNFNPGIDNITADFGYNIEKITQIKEKNLLLYELEHLATGAKHIHISCRDNENTFGVALKTVPCDSTGVAHILEHTALCGSKKYPVRDPFFSMLKRSLSTFMNAFTASDWTMYPFSTQNKKDFYNLMDVYLNAVFFPLLDELSFKQEGHRIEIEKDSSDLVYKGVVYNEMKGAMSSPDQIMARSLLKALYPDTTYSNNSGGDPAVIPALTCEQLKTFHKRHYHPGNSFFFTYGNLPLKEHLLFINKNVLQKFGKMDPGTEILPQPRWNKPKESICKYPLDKNDDPEKKYQVAVAWLMADIRESFEIFALSLLSHILLGNSGSYLRKALIDSGLGSSLCDGCGYDSDNRDSMFVAGLKDVKKTDAEKIVSIIFNTLKNLADYGIDKELIESAIHQLEFGHKEVTNSPYPYGLKLFLTICGPWLHRCDPKTTLQIEDDLTRLRQKISKENFFENMIKKYFLENTHRTIFTMEPDREMEERENIRVSSELKNIKQKLTKPELEKIIADTHALEKLQEKKENLACLPTLQLKDIPPSIQKVKETAAYPDIPISVYNQPTSGIFYFSTIFGASMVPEEIIPLVPFFCSTFTRTGTQKKDYTEIARLIDRYTGGVSMGFSARAGFDEAGSCIPIISFNSKCIDRYQKNMFELIWEILAEHTFSDIFRLKTLLFEFRANLESIVIQNGHRFAMQLASRNFSPACALGEIWGGIHQLQTIKDITDNLTDDRLEDLSETLTSLGKTIFTQNNFNGCMIGGDQGLGNALNFAKTTKQILQYKEGVFTNFQKTEKCTGVNNTDNIPYEGWHTTSAVSFVVKAFRTVRMNHQDAPALSAISKILKSMYLHREIREKGGAYGGFSLYNSEDGIFYFASYRDPHIIRTLDIYQKGSEFITKGDYTNEDVKEAILQICSEIDSPDSPADAAKKGFMRKIIFLTDEKRKLFKENLLKLNRARIMETANKYFSTNGKKEAVVVISSKEKIKAANKKLNNPLLKLRKI